MRKASVLLFALILLAARDANADPDPSQDQDWTVDGFRYFGQGLLAPMLLQTYVAKGHQALDDGTVASDKLTRTSMRFFYGLTDHINLFLQLNTAHPNGESYEMEGFEGGFHVKFYEGHGFHLGFAWENEWQRAPKYVDNAYDMDFHPLIQQDIGPVSFLLNPIFEKDFIGAGCWEGSYSFQSLYNWSKEYSAGLEFYGDVGAFKDMGQVHEQGHYIMPVVNLKYVSLGLGIGLTAGSDRVIAKVNVSYPVDLGTLW
jgi:hypothetical protein